MSALVSAALVKAQRGFAPALKNASNPHFGKAYADLGACVEAVLSALNDNGIALTQHARECSDGVTVETVLVHESGEVMAFGPLHVPASKNDPQGYGSALTYARRYSLMTALGIAPEDDDGNAATKPAQKTQSRETSKQPQEASAEQKRKIVAIAEAYIARWEGDMPPDAKALRVAAAILNASETKKKDGSTIKAHDLAHLYKSSPWTGATIRKLEEALQES